MKKIALLLGVLLAIPVNSLAVVTGFPINDLIQDSNTVGS
jgi:hypothetical protein